MMNVTPWKKWFVLGVACAALAGCASNSTAPTAEKTATGSEDSKVKSLKITLIAKSNDNPVFQSARIGAEAAAKDLSAKTGVPISIDWRTPDKEDGTVQAQRIAQAVNDGANAVIIACSDAAKVTGAINDAVDKGVPVMTFDSDAPNSKRFAFYGANDIDCGKQIMTELATAIGSTGNVAILAGNQNAPNLQKRVEGVKEAAKGYPNIKIIDTYYHNESPQDAAAAVQSAMKARPEINAWAMVGGWPLFTKTLLTDLDPAKVKIVAVDCLPAQMPYVEKGICPVLLAQPIYDWGYVSVERVVDKIVLKKEVPVMNRMELQPIRAQNLSQWAHKLKDWGFTDVDPRYMKINVGVGAKGN